MTGRRWEDDQRGEGLASGESMVPNLEELTTAMRAHGWVAEEPEAHLLPHLQAAFDEPGSPWRLAGHATDDGIFTVDVEWTGEPAPRRALRAAAFVLLGRIAEESTHVRQRIVDDRLEFELATGTLPTADGRMPHGHLVRLRVRAP